MSKHAQGRRPQRSKAMRTIVRMVNLIGDGAESRAYRIAMNSYEQGVR
jgi:hypothetical protein